MSKADKGPIEVITEGFETLRVVQAWRQIDAGHRDPVRVELLRRKNKSLIYRFVGAGVGGGDVIVKGSVFHTAFVERAIYADILPQLPVSQLRYYGFSADRGEGFSWLFLEEVGGIEFDPEEAAHRALAARWLGALHVSASMAPPSVPLPERGPSHYREHMLEARHVIEQSYENPLLGREEHTTLDRILNLFEVTESRWNDIEALCGQLPQTLVHGDFAERNVHVLEAPESAATLIAFDWEVAGWGLPVVDLAHVDLPVYWSVVREAWSSLDYETLAHLVHVGKLLRGGIAATNWTVPSLCTTWPNKAIEHMRIYDQRMTAAMRAIGWAA